MTEDEDEDTEADLLREGVAVSTSSFSFVSLVRVACCDDSTGSEPADLRAVEDEDDRAVEFAS